MHQIALCLLLLDWIISAPRANRLFGQVNIFARDASATQSSDRGGDPFRDMRFTLTGNQVRMLFTQTCRYIATAYMIGFVSFCSLFV